MDENVFVTFRKLPASSNDAIEGATWEVYDEIFQNVIGIVGWSGVFKEYGFAPYHNVLLGPNQLEDIAKLLREEANKRGTDNARDTVFGRD
jgi:hypothetical protein